MAITDQELVAQVSPPTGTGAMDEISRHSTGRKLMQVLDTVTFEWRRNLRKTLVLAVVMAALSLLTFFTNWYQYDQGVPVPDDPVDYISGYLALFSFLIYIIGTAYAAPTIATDFERETGNLIFPKIDRDRLLVGRLLGNYALAALQILVYYAMIAAFTWHTVGKVPRQLASSLAWALFFMLGVMSFTVLFSSFMKSTSFTLVAALLILLIGFSIVEQLVVMFTGIEPLFSLPYYSNIISNSLEMPDQRSREFKIPLGPRSDGSSSGETFNFTQWITPNYPGAFWGILSYSVLCLAGAFLLFHRRQGK
ncbi:MAG: hypothetical protein ACTSU5_04885 [Promethearchaeota archaeon]